MKLKRIGIAVLLLGVLCSCRCVVFAEESEALSQWKAAESAVDRLGETFTDARIQIKIPKNLQKLDRPDPPELVKLGVFNYRWVTAGETPSMESVTITLTPYAMPSADALDKTIEGMHSSFKKNLSDPQFGKVRAGRLGKNEVRAGNITAEIQGEKVTFYYLVGIDETGTFSVSALLPESAATPQRIEEMKNSLLTFERPK